MRYYSSKLLHIVLIALVLASCQKDKQTEFPRLTLVSKHSIDITGLSGLSLYDSDSTFIAVEDNQSRVHFISNSGNIIKTLNFSGNDLEGVTYVPNDSTIYIVEEKKKEIVKLDTDGNEMGRIPVSLNNTDEKHGLEGITYNSLNDHLYVVSEQSPSLLIEMTLSGEVIRTNELTFAKDYSGIYFNPPDSSLWIVSDRSRIVAKCDLLGNPIQLYSTESDKFEGIVVESESTTIYLVNDRLNMLYVYTY